MALNEVLARLSVVLGLDTAAFTTGSRRARAEATGLEKSFASLKRVGGAIAGAFVATGVVEIATAFKDAGKAALESAGGIGEQAAALGVSTTALQQFRFAATQVGLSTEQMDAALGQFSKRLGAAELSGKGPFVTALEQIGLSLDELKGKSETDQIALIADGIGKAGSQAQQSALQVQFFGKAGQSMATLLSEGSAGIKAYAEEAKRLGIVLSEGEIAKADETADKLAKLQYVIDAQQNRKLLENSDAIVAYEQAIGGLKLAAIGAIGGLESTNQRYNAWALSFNASLRRAINGVVEYFQALPGRVLGSLERLLTGAKSWLTDKLTGVLDAVGRKAKWVGDKFFELYDRVVGHSYVPDMVDGIAAEMARLDAAMVDPADRATKKTGESFRQLAGEVQGILDRLFPSLATARRYAADAAKLNAGIADPAARETALRALRRENAGLPTEGPAPAEFSFDIEEAAGPMGRLSSATDELGEKLARLGDRAKDTTVRVAKSFKDMADATLSSISRLAERIKGGSFLGILEAVVGLGMQLGSIGVFGSKVANRLNANAYASGTRSAARGLALVGERGPELVNFGGGERVWSNRETRGMAVGGVTHNHFTGNLMTPEFWAMIQAGDDRAARTGAGLAHLQSARSRQWSLA